MRGWHPRAHALRKNAFPHRRARACPSPVRLDTGRLHHPCRSGSPDPDLFVIRRSQTTEERNVPLTVGRGPVPRQRSCARACRAGLPDLDPFVIRRSQTTEERNVPLTVGRGPVPRQRSCARACRAGLPDLDPFVIRRSQTTEERNVPPLTVGRGPVPRHRSRNPTLAGDRPPRYDKK